MAVLLIIPLIAAALLLIPLVQTSVVGWLSNYASTYIGSEISIGSVYIKPFNELELGEVLVRDVRNDTMIYSQHIALSFQGIEPHTSVIRFNVIDVRNAYFNLNVAEGDTIANFTHFMNAFPASDSNASSVVKIDCQEVRLSQVRFRYDDFNIPEESTGSIDYDHLYISDFGGVIKSVYLVNDSILACLEGVHLNEKSGFEIKNLTCEAAISSRLIACRQMYLEANNSVVKGYFEMKTKSWSSYVDFFTQVDIESQLINSDVRFDDIAYFAPQVRGLLSPMKFTGTVTGPLSNLKANVDSVFFAETGVLKGRVKIKGLPSVSSLFVDADIKHFYSSVGDLAQLNIPNDTGYFQIQLPIEAERLQYATFKGKFIGFVNDFVTYGSGQTGLGSFKTDINLKSGGEQLVYAGKLSTADFELGKMFDIESTLGTVGFDLEINGSGIEKKTMEMDAKGEITFIHVLNYKYQNLKIDGAMNHQVFKGNVASRDTNISFDFSGVVDFNLPIPQINCVAEIQSLRPGKLGIIPTDTFGLASANISLEMTGNSLSTIAGNLKVTEFDYRNQTQNYSFDQLQLIDKLLPQNEHDIRIESDFISAHIRGATSIFDLPYAVIKVGARYAPAYFADITLVGKDTVQNFHIDVKVDNDVAFTKFLSSSLRLNQPFILHGDLNTVGDLVSFQTDSLSWQLDGLKVEQHAVSISNEKESLIITSKAKKINLSDGFFLENQSIVASLKNDSLLTDIHWNNETEQADSGAVNLTLYHSDQFPLNAVLNQMNMRIAGVEWRSNATAELRLDSNRIVLKNLDLSSPSGLISGDGEYSTASKEHLKIRIKDLDLKYLTNFNIIEQQIDGVFNGDIDIYQRNGNTIAEAQLLAENLFVDDFEVGSIQGRSNYSDQTKSIGLDVDLSYRDERNVTLMGDYYPWRTKNQLDLEARLSNFRIALIEPFIADFVSDMQGNIDGNVTITGNLTEPQLLGTLRMEGVVATIDYLKTRYKISDSDINVTPDLFAINNAKVIDENDQKAELVAGVFHSNFRNWSYDVFLTTHQFMVLNTTYADNEDYYGLANFTGEVSISGSTKSTFIDVVGATSKDSKLVIPLSGSSEVGESGFIRFIQRKDQTKNKVAALNEEMMGLELDFRLTVNDSAEVQLIFDEKIGDMIKVRGFGNLLMRIDNRGNFNMYGDYVINNGDYLFTLQNVVNKRFSVAPGSKVVWNGSPYDAKTDLTAIYSLRTSASTLMQSIDPGNPVYEKRMPVEVSLNLHGALLEPTITFDVDITGLPQTDLANQLLDRGSATEEMINQQAFSLLLANTFAPIGGGIELGGAGASTTYDMLSNQFSNWASKYFKNLDVGIDLSQGTGTNKALQPEVSLSRQFFDNRLSVEVNGSVQSDESTASSVDGSKASNLTGDFNLEYRINRKGTVRGKAFNKANNYNAVNQNQSPYTQGVGLSFQKDFNTIAELFRRNKRNEAAREERKQQLNEQEPPKVESTPIKEEEEDTLKIE